MVRFLLLLACMAVVGCATQPPAPPQALFDDAAFPARPVRAPTDAIEASAAMKRYLDTDIAATLRSKGRLGGLIDALQNQAKLRLEYDAAQTRTAAEAFDARLGNCLALVLMTAAMAKELGLPVHFQRVYSADSWSRDGDFLFRSGHVNLVLGERPLDRRVSSDPNRWITIDFLPHEDVRGYRTRPISESTVLAMYMNNRAAESLARGQVAEAYWWARDAIVQDATFLDAYNTLGVVYSRRADPGRAERVYRAVLQLAPEEPVTLANLEAILRSAGRDAEARSVRQVLQRVEPEPPFQYYDLARAAMARGDFRSARALFAKELARNPHFHGAHFGLAAASWELGDVAGAGEHLSAAMEHSPTRRDHELYAAKLDWLRSLGPR